EVAPPGYSRRLRIPPQPAEPLRVGRPGQALSDLLEDAGHDDEEGRSDLRERADRVLRIGFVADRHALRDADELQGSGEDMGEWEKDEGRALVVHDLGIVGADVENLADEVSMGEDHAFGQTLG